MKSWLVSCVLAALAASLGCADDTPLVDETGFLKGDLVRYTADVTLGAEPSPVALIGLPGAVTRLGGELSATSAADPTAIPGFVAADGSFVVLLGARLNDTVTLRYVLGGAAQTLDVALSDPLGAIPRPVATGGSSGSGTLTVAVGSNHTVAVDLAQLVSRGRDVIVFNEDAGGSSRATPSDTRVTLAGERGDRVCVFALEDTTPLASTSLCALAN